MKKISAIILYSILSYAAAFAQSVETSGFSPKAIPPNGTARYTLSFKDVKGSADISKIPLPDGLQIVGQSSSRNMSIINGSVSRETSVVLTMRADREGELTIPEWETEIGGRKYKIAAATLTVDKSAPAESGGDDAFADPFGGSIFGSDPFFSRQSAQRQIQRRQQARSQIQSFEANLKNNAKLEIKLPREKIYVGESVPCELVFSFDKSLSERGFTLAQLLPEIQKADAFDCPAFSEKPTISSDGNRVLVKYTTAITPLKAGSYDLDISARGVFQRELRADDLAGMSIFDRMMSFGGGTPVDFKIDMPPKKIDVLELPENGKPADFTGAIGTFSLENAAVEPDALTVGEPCTITAKVVGVGNFPRIREPKLDAGADWKTYKAKSSFTDESNGLSNIGIKTFEYTAVPKKADIPTAPTVRFNYFDPVGEKYVELNSAPLPISVAPTGRSKRAAETEQSSPAPAFDKIAETAAHSSDARLLESPYFWGAQIVFLCAVAAFVMLRRESLRKINDVRYAKKIADRKSAAKHRSLAAAAAKRGDFNAFFEEARRALQFAVAADSERSAESLTARDAAEILAETKPDADVGGLRLFFDGADALAFGGTDTSKLDIKKLDAQLGTLVGKLSK